MRIPLIAAALLQGLLFASTPAGAAVTVSFVDSDRYTDAGASANDRQRAMAEIERHLRRLGDRHFAAGQNFKIEVLDIDLAGRMRFVRRFPDEVRVVDGRTDWPRIKLRYTLESAGKVTKSGEETVSDLDYLSAPRAPGSSEPLYYEKRMLDDWYLARFGKQPRGP